MPFNTIDSKDICKKIMKLNAEIDKLLYDLLKIQQAQALKQFVKCIPLHKSA